MKISTKTLYDNIITNLNRASTDMIKANEVVSTGKKINRASDDPMGLMSVLDIRSSMANIDQLGRNITAGRLWITVGESSLNQVDEFLYQAKAVCIDIKDEEKTGLARENAADAVDEYLKQILSFANAKVGDSYIFAGTKTDTKPFFLDESDPEVKVKYKGNANPFSVKVGIDTDVAVGRNGEEVFGVFGENWDYDNIFKTLIDVKQHIMDNNKDEIEMSIEKIESHLKAVRSVISDATVKITQFDIKEKIIKDLDFAYDNKRSLLEDADINEAVVKLKIKELAYQSALSASASVMDLSIMNYL